MKTKVEAMANPEAGDTWEMADGRIRAVLKVGPSEIKWWAIVNATLADGRFRKYTTFPSTWKSFEKWAGASVFMGNASVIGIPITKKEADNAKNPR